MSGYFIVGIVLALVVLVDSARRQMPMATGLIYVGATIILWPIVAPLYFARRPLRKGERRVGGTFWHWTRYFVAIWTIGMIMLAALLAFGATGLTVEDSADAVGVTAFLSVTGALLCGIWIVPTVVLLVLGLVLRNDNVQEGPTGPLAEV